MKPSGSSPGLLNAMLRTVGSYVNPTPASDQNKELCRVLDDDGAAGQGPSSTDQAAGNGALDRLEEEQMLRSRAESDAQEATRRLVVAQEQLAEYATQKDADTAKLLQQATALEQALSALLRQQQPADDAAAAAAATDGAAAPLPAALAEQLQALRQALEDEAREARAFAVQQAADAERLKRSSDQARLAAGGEASPSGGDAKRARDEPHATDEDGDEPMVAQDEVAVADAAQGDGEEEEGGEEEGGGGGVGQPAAWDYSERCKYIPLRLTMDERRLLRLLEAALSVSEYTDKVDVMTWRSKTARIHAQIKDLCAILCGLVVAQNYKRGQQLIVDRSFKENAEFFQDVFEVGRRYKVMNPDKMRSDYGKLMFMLMDSADGAVQDLLEFKCVRPLRTVASLLEERGGLDMLNDVLMETATAEIVAGDRPRHEIQRDIKRKEKARAHLAAKYRSNTLSEEDILRCLYSISDNNSFLLFNRDPIDKAILYMTSYFSPSSAEHGYSLAIQAGNNGARLSHNHERQYMYALQSLMLWREINNDMFKLWCMAESDMLSERNPYRLTNTGQGLNRVQQAPSVSRAIHGIIARCQRRLGNWVGSSVVHLGDHNVPNALLFIDKYTQVPRILNPVVLVLDCLPQLAKDAGLSKYITAEFGGVEQCRKAMLCDFVRHAFDGSGADNFFDAGSCIDGRLTSAWNWCAKIEKKRYYYIFKMAGFVGFDGDFQR